MLLPLEYSNSSVIKRIAMVGSSVLALKHQEGLSELTRLLLASIFVYLIFLINFTGKFT